MCLDGRFRCYLVTDSGDLQMVRELRREVFVLEQKVPETLEFDGLDERALHIICKGPSGECVGCTRLVEVGGVWHLQRVAVRRDLRGRGVGRALVHRAVSEAKRRGARTLLALVQQGAAEFYRKMGFLIRETPVMEAGIPHYPAEMILDQEADEGDD